jgi:hypothetical protein
MYLIERTELARAWLESAARCECPNLSECPLFDDPRLPPRHDADRRPRPGSRRGRAAERPGRRGPPPVRRCADGT